MGPGATFQTNPILLQRLLHDCHKGTLKLPDFQRSWVWDEDRIKSLIASVSRAFPIGALMTLATGGAVNFAPRRVEGAPREAESVEPELLLLDGQQRMTSLYQVTIRREVVATKTPKNKKVKRWFYIDIAKALDETADREEAVVAVPEDRILRSDFGRKMELDLSSREKEYEALHFPLTEIFDFFTWNFEFQAYWAQRGQDGLAAVELFTRFREGILAAFNQYQVPVITLDRSTSKEAVCVVFEKVNTGGKALDAFELVTAMYAADGHRLRDDWYGTEVQPMGRQARLADTLRPGGQKRGILAEVSSTDFLQAVSLFHTREKRREAEAAGKQGRDLPAVTGNKQALLSLPLAAYKKYQDKVEQGFVHAAKILHQLNIYRTFDLPYQSQIVPLAAILADLGDEWEHDAYRAKLVKWYWNGVFGELYGSSTETRVARDFLEVPEWLRGGPEPTTVREAVFRADRLNWMRSRLSAAYKGVNALLMERGARDFRSGQKFAHAVFFDENVDIHHIFPQQWCKNRGIPSSTYDSVINKTPLSFRTNRIIGGGAPSQYLSKLERGIDGAPAQDPSRLDEHLVSHLIAPQLLRSDNFEDFMEDRKRRLIRLIEEATGKAIYQGTEQEEGEYDNVADDPPEESDPSL